jgi:general L-amino acid transport system permease protein
MADHERRRREALLGLREDVSVGVVDDVGRVVESAPVKEPKTPGEWIKVNLFSGPVNAILSIVSGAFLIFVVLQIIDFLFVGGQWQVVRVNMKAYMVGGFPAEELWRVWTCLYLLAALAGVSLGAAGKTFTLRARVIPRLVIALAVAVLVLGFTVQSSLARIGVVGVPVAVAVSYLIGRAFPRPVNRVRLPAWILLFPVMMFIVRGFDGVPPRQWEGLFFNLTAATVGIFASFPIGIALALGRRSSLRAVRTFSVIVIEIFRGVPLVAWLVFSKYIVDLLLPPQLNLPDIIKALVMMTMFSAAYIAEIVRGGLQGVHQGQYEAGRALGLSTIRLNFLVVLPQALRATIPAMIGHFISLFKDTSLFSAIQVTELLDAGTRSSIALEFLGRDAEALLFVALFFWVVAFSMSRWSQRLEIRLGVGER